MKKIARLSLLLATISINFILPNEAPLHTIKEQSIGQLVPFGELTIFDATNEQSKWAFIEKKFITDIHTGKQLTWSHLNSAIPTAFAAFSGYKHANITDQKKETDIIKNILKLDNIYLIGGTLSAFMVTAQYVEYYLTYQANRNAIRSFFANWNQNQLYVPKELLPYFTLLAQKIEAQGEDIVLQDAKKIINDIKFMITRHFESRYKKFLEIEGYNSTAETKTISDILKNFIGTAKDLAA